MGRLLLFLLGLAIGGALVSLLYQNGTLHVEAAPSPVVAPNGVVLPNLPNAPATGVPAPAPGVPAALPPPSPAVSDGAEPDANTGEQPQPPTPEAAAALAAAQVVGGAQLLMPVQGIKAGQLVDTYTQSRGEGRLHDAIDIMAARGTPVLAVADGRVAKLFTSDRGGLTVYQFDGEEKLAYYYAHLDSYAPGLAEGSLLKRGALVGFVGSTGNANPAAPHLHFAVFVLGPEKHWWQGTAVNPYPLLGGR